MILGFKTKFKDNQPTLFVEKILAGVDAEYKKLYTPKIHSLREGYRWCTGDEIHMATGARTSSYHQFNKPYPQLQKCISTQDVFMTYIRHQLEVTIDDKYMWRPNVELLMLNDGLTRERFINWFFPGPKDEWSGQIIHWTDFKY
jgi:hypothetical protein